MTLGSRATKYLAYSPKSHNELHTEARLRVTVLFILSCGQIGKYTSQRWHEGSASSNDGRKTHFVSL